jgi:hypothetical protein
MDLFPCGRLDGKQHVKASTDVKLIITMQLLNFTHINLKIYKTLMLLCGIELARWPADRQ